MIGFTEYIGFFRLFYIMVGGQNDQIYLIYWIFFRLFDFSIFCWEVNMIDITEYFDFCRRFSLQLEGHLCDFTVCNIFFRLFDLSTSRREVKIIDFTKYIDFFRIFVFLTSWWEDRMIDFTEYILNFSTFRPRGGKSK